MFDIEFLKQYFRDLFARAFSKDGWLIKLWPLWSLFLVCLVATLFSNQLKAGLMIYGLAKVLMGGLLGLVVHWGFRRLHPMPDEPSGITIGTDWKCAAWIICACILALAFVP